MLKSYGWECAGGHVELPLVLDLAVHLEIGVDESRGSF